MMKAHTHTPPQNSKKNVLGKLRAKEGILTEALDALRKTIKGVELHVEDEEEIPPKSGKAHAAFNGGAPKNAPAELITGRRGTRRAVRTAITEQTGVWKSIALRAYLDTHFPALSPKITNARLSQEIYAARIDGIIKYHVKSPAGGAHSYMTIHKPA